MYHFKVIKMYEKYLKGTYRAIELETWGFEMT